MTDLAEVTLDEALASLDPPVPMAIVAMGRFGGAELSYASDLDVLLVSAARPNAEARAAEETAEALVRTVNGHDAGGAALHRSTPTLRPEGRDGPLARSLDGYRSLLRAVGPDLGAPGPDPGPARRRRRRRRRVASWPWSTTSSGGARWTTTASGRSAA